MNEHHTARMSPVLESAARLEPMTALSMKDNGGGKEHIGSRSLVSIMEAIVERLSAPARLCSLSPTPQYNDWDEV
jgi:hypothetical protein